MNFTENNALKNNWAANAGGGIKWDDIEPTFDGTTTYENNTGYLYGDNVACFAQNIILIN